MPVGTVPYACAVIGTVLICAALAIAYRLHLEAVLMAASGGALVVIGYVTRNQTVINIREVE